MSRRGSAHLALLAIVGEMNRTISAGSSTRHAVAFGLGLSLGVSLLASSGCRPKCRPNDRCGGESSSSSESDAESSSSDGTGNNVDEVLECSTPCASDAECAEDPSGALEIACVSGWCVASPKFCASANDCAAPYDTCKTSTGQCQLSCSEVATCETAFPGVPVACEGAVCVPLGCSGDADCGADQVCTNNGACVARCSNAADCALGGLLFEADNFMCDGDECVYLGCRTDDECVQATGRDDAACR